jgi:hypothetical protein
LRFADAPSPPRNPTLVEATGYSAGDAGREETLSPEQTDAGTNGSASPKRDGLSAVLLRVIDKVRGE